MITIKNLIDIDPISAQFWCESYLWPYIDNVLCVQCFRLFLKYNLFHPLFRFSNNIYIDIYFSSVVSPCLPLKRQVLFIYLVLLFCLV